MIWFIIVCFLLLCGIISFILWIYEDLKKTDIIASENIFALIFICTYMLMFGPFELYMRLNSKIKD